MIEVEVGTVVRGREIGKTPTRKYIRSRCRVCGAEWWGDYSHVNNGGAKRICKPCNRLHFSAQARAANKRPEFSSAIDSNCVHHWIIPEADGATSDGICKKCGIVKAFANSIQAEGVQQINLISKGPDVKRYIREQIRRENDTEY